MTDIDTLQAGPELDALVAEKVMGWAFADGCWNEPSGPRRAHPRSVYNHFPYYSTDIAAAWEVIEKLPGPGIALFKTYNGGWQARTKVCNYPGSMHVIENDCCIFSDAPTAPLAICRAALKAVQS